MFFLCLSWNFNERCNRGATNPIIQYKKITGGHTIQQWRKLLCSPGNKTSLIKFLVQEWKMPVHRKKLGGKILYATCEEKCYRMTTDDWTEASELHSTQEEADTRLLLHAATSGSKAVIITAEDTDVLVLCLTFHKIIPCPVYQKRGTQNRTLFIDISKLGKALGECICHSLIELHAFTGCDTVSAFAGHGKLSALNLLKKNITFQDTSSQLGQTWDVSSYLIDNLQQFTCNMYVSRTSTSKVNDLRYQIFCAKRGVADSSQLPPCKECLSLHILRANYQAKIWGCSLQAHPSIQDPTMNGWMTGNDGKLAINWMRTPPAPDIVLALIACKCVRVCKLPDCTCLNNGLKCTDLCKLQIRNKSKNQKLIYLSQKALMKTLKMNSDVLCSGISYMVKH